MAVAEQNIVPLYDVYIVLFKILTYSFTDTVTKEVHALL